MNKAKKVVSCFILCALIFSVCACGSEDQDTTAVYGKTIGGLEDNELFVTIDTNAPLPVLLVTSQVYDDDTGNQAALQCDVYYLVDKEVKKIGTLESLGTAYPISYDETGIYTASGHAMQRFEIDQSGTMKLAEVIQAQFDENGNAAYTMTKDDETKTISEEDFYSSFEKYSNATVVSFAYGASDAARNSVLDSSKDISYKMCYTKTRSYTKASENAV